MDAHVAGRISELARSLYEHRLAGSMEEAVEMAQRMIHGDPGTKKSTEESLTNKEQRWLTKEQYVPETVEPEHPEREVVFGAEPETELVDVEPEEVEAPEEVEKSEPEVVDVPEPEPPTAGELVGNELPEEVPCEEEKREVLEEEEELPSPDDIDAELSNIKLSHEGAEDRLQDLRGEIKDFKEELQENIDEFDEIKEYLKDLENMAETSGDAIKKEEAGVKTAEIADKPATEHGNRSEDTRDQQE